MLNARVLAPIAAAVMALAACMPLLPATSPLSPQSAGAQPQAPMSVPERIARQSVPVSGAVEQAAEIGQLIPAVSVPATFVERFAEGYHAEMQRQIAGLEERLRQTGQPADPRDWWWAILFAAGAGASNVFSFRAGQKKGA